MFSRKEYTLKFIDLNKAKLVCKTLLNFVVIGSRRLRVTFILLKKKTPKGGACSS